MISLQCKVYPSANAFLGETLDQIEQQSWQSNNFLGPILQTANSENNGIYGDKAFFIAVWDGNLLIVTSARIGSESNPVALFSPLEESKTDLKDAVHLLVEHTIHLFDQNDWSTRYTDKVAMLGTPALVLSYAKQWETFTGLKVELPPPRYIAASRVHKTEYEASSKSLVNCPLPPGHRVREASIADLDQLTILTTAFHADLPFHMTTDECRTYIQNVFRNTDFGLEERFLVYEVNSELTSLCLMRRPTSKTIAFAWVYTASKWQRQGHAMRLLWNALELAFNKMGKEYVCLNFEPDNQTARRLYAKLGFHMDVENDISIQQNLRLNFIP